MDKKNLIPSLFLGAISILIFFGFTYTDLSFFKSFERIFYDFGTNLQFNQVNEKPKIALISIDEKSISRLGPLPWSRNLISHMIHTLEEGEIQTIGVDLAFFNEEQNRGLNELRALKKQAITFFPSKREKRIGKKVLKAIEQAEENSDNDRRLAESIDSSKKVILPFFGSPTKNNNKPRGKKALNISKDFLRPQLSPERFRNIFFAASLKLPLPSLAQAALGLGHNRLVSAKNIYERSHPPAIKYQGALLPSFPLRVAMAYLKVNPEQTIVQDEVILLKNKSIPLVDGDILFRCDKNEKAFLKYSFVDILQARKAPSILKGKIALIGQETTRNKLQNGPFFQLDPSQGEISANIVENILNNRFIKRPKFSLYYELSFLILMLLVTAFFFTKIREVYKLIFMLSMIVIVLLLGVFLLSFWGVWFRVGSIATCLAAFYVLMSARQLFSIDRIAGDTVEANRALGLSLKNQGLLDLALEKLMACPLDNKTKDNIYDLGLEFEQRNMVGKALTAFKYVNKGGGFRDLDERIRQLEGKDILSDSDGQLFENDQNILSTTFIQGRGKVGRFRILEELGRGTMGLVYKGLDPKINRLLAIKIIRFSDEFDEEHIQEIQNRFFTEAEIAGKLSHPSIVTIYDVGEDQDLTYMAMEYLEGKDLAFYSAKENLLPLPKVLDIAIKVADALEYAHQADVIHRDIKPANIMLLKNGDVKVTDFGIAKAISSSRTKTGVILGTPNYMSPEQIMGYQIDARSDIFSLGVLFFQLLTGKLPFHGENLSNLLYLITQGKHPPVREFNKRIPKACEQIIDKAMAKDPRDRFNTAGEMGKYLNILISKLERVSKI